MRGVLGGRLLDEELDRASPSSSVYTMIDEETALVAATFMAVRTPKGRILVDLRDVVAYLKVQSEVGASLEDVLRLIEGMEFKG